MRRIREEDAEKRVNLDASAKRLLLQDLTQPGIDAPGGVGDGSLAENDAPEAGTGHGNALAAVVGRDPIAHALVRLGPCSDLILAVENEHRAVHTLVRHGDAGVALAVGETALFGAATLGQQAG